MKCLRDERGDMSSPCVRAPGWCYGCLHTRAGQLVGKDEIMDEVWSDCEVTEDSLVQAIGDIRRALGDAGRSASEDTASSWLHAGRRRTSQIDSFVPFPATCLGRHPALPRGASVIVDAASVHHCPAVR